MDAEFRMGKKVSLGQGNIPRTSLQNVAAITKLSLNVPYESIGVRMHDKLS